MWIYTSKGMISVVQKDCDAGILCVRARVREHLAAIFPDYTIIDTPKGDYLFRAYVPKGIVSQRIASLLVDLNYDNFKNSIPQEMDEYHTACHKVWGATAPLGCGYHFPEQLPAVGHEVQDDWYAEQEDANYFNSDEYWNEPMPDYGLKQPENPDSCPFCGGGLGEAFICKECGMKTDIERLR